MLQTLGLTYLLGFSSLMVVLYCSDVKSFPEEKE